MNTKNYNFAKTYRALIHIRHALTNLVGHGVFDSFEERKTAYDAHQLIYGLANKFVSKTQTQCDCPCHGTGEVNGYKMLHLTNCCQGECKWCGYNFHNLERHCCVCPSNPHNKEKS